MPTSFPAATPQAATGGRRRLLGGLAAGALGLAWPWGAHASTVVMGQPTNLVSDSERMISYRHQNHMWQTADGALHLVFNRGTLLPNPGLALCSSFDGGLSWQIDHALPGTTANSSADGLIEDGVLHLVYSVASGDIVYDAYTYADGVWTLQLREAAFSSALRLGINPALGIDAAGTVWCGFVARTRANAATDIRMVARPAGGGWVDTGLTFGPTDSRSIERSARPVRIGGGMGMVYKVRENTFWARREDGNAIDADWQGHRIRSGPLVRRLTDPYSSHFSVNTTDDGAVHLVLIEDYNVLYFRGAAGGLQWTAPLQFDDEREVVYAQLAVIDGKLAVGYGASALTAAKRGAVHVSADNGASFGRAAELTPVRGIAGANFRAPRVELPMQASGPLRMLQQFQQDNLFRALLYVVPVP